MNQEIKKTRLIYTDPSTGMLCIVHPSGETSIEFIANNTVPKGVEYWIVSDDDIPEDRSFRDAWELDEDSSGNPNGIGGAEL